MERKLSILMAEQILLISSALDWAWGGGSGEQWWTAAERRLGRYKRLLAVRSAVHVVYQTSQFSRIFGLVHSKFAFFFSK